MGEAVVYTIDIATRQEWIDYNGHVTDAAFAVIAAEANEALLAAVGISEDYRRESGRALYSRRLEIDFLAEIPAVGTITVASSVDKIGTSSVIMLAAITREDGVVAGRTRHVYVLVDGPSGEPIALSEAQRAALEA